MEVTNYFVVTMNDGSKFVPLQQAEAIRRERDAALIANKNLNTLLYMTRRCMSNVDNGTEREVSV